MTNEETIQVQHYIAQLQAKHAQEISTLQKQVATEQRFRKIAQADSLKMGTAVHTIWDLSRTQPAIPVDTFATNVRQIINYYCPDFDIPF